jgi:hypothetical protein
MKVIKYILNYPEDYFGPLAHIHAMEGTGCHMAALNWLACKHGWLPEYESPSPIIGHPNSSRWDDVVRRAVESFSEFSDKFKVDPIAIEQPHISTVYSLIGHPDLVCNLEYKKMTVQAVVELKFTSSIQESHRLQTRCYGKLVRGSQLGGIFQCNRDTGAWKFEPVDLTINLDDVAAVSYAAKLWAWGEQKKGAQ